jgi:Viral BACON domain
MEVAILDSWVHRSQRIIFRLHRAFAVILLFGLIAIVAGCGGGGGSTDATPPPTGGAPPPAPSGTFTMSANSASFTVLQAGTIPASQTFDIAITGSGAAIVGAAYTAGQTQPTWLTVAITGSGSHYQLLVGVVPSAVNAGQYTSTFSVGTADAGGNILAHQDFTVSLTANPHLTASTAASTQTLIFGDTTTAQIIPIGVTAPSKQWTASSDSSWLHISTAAQTGSTTINATADDSGLMPGTYQGAIRFLAGDESDDSASISVSLTVTPAVLTVAEPSYTFGGIDGRAALSADPVTISLSTGQGVYPYTVTVSTDNGGPWLSAATSSGSVGSAATQFNLNANSASLLGGTYTGHIHVATSVNGVALAQDRVVTLNIEANRLVLSAAGVNLSNVAGQAVLTRTVKVLSALGRTNTPWTANSDSTWLTVTATGVTGDDLVLTANPAGLPLDATQFANVTVSSSDVSVENQPVIRVGFFGSNTATASGSLTLAANRLASSPVEPIVAIGSGGTDIGIYNVYTHTLLRTLSNIVATSDGMAFSEDGKTLFVYDTTNFRVVEVDAVTGAQKRSYDSTPHPAGASVGTALAVVHPNGLATLVTPAGRVYDVSTGSELPAPAFATAQFSGYRSAVGVASSPDQSLLVDQDGVTAGLVRSALAGGSLFVTPNPVLVSTAQGAPGESCFSASGDRIYTASGYPYDFPATSVATGQIIQTLAGTNYPNSMQCVWNGLVIGGIDGFYAPYDMFVYYGPTGEFLAQISSNGLADGNRSLLNRGMAVSADGTILISAWAAQPGTTSSVGVYFQTLPAP